MARTTSNNVLKKTASFTLEQKVIKWLKKKADEENRSVSSFLNNFIIKYAKAYSKGNS
jgi:hypothetical protein